MLLTAMWLPAVGAVRVSDSVQRCFEAMAWRMAGLTKNRSSTGLWTVRKNPIAAPTQKTAVARRIGRAAARTLDGQVRRRNSAAPLDLARPD